jgi:hypothetical protein
MLGPYIHAKAMRKIDSMSIPAAEGPELSDAELLRRAVTYSRPNGFEVVEKWREVASLFAIDETVARSLCKRFGADPDKLVAR